jgi:hypothetical protein
MMMVEYYLLQIERFGLAVGALLITVFLVRWWRITSDNLYFSAAMFWFWYCAGRTIPLMTGTGIPVDPSSWAFRNDVVITRGGELIAMLAFMFYLFIRDRAGARPS